MHRPVGSDALARPSCLAGHYMAGDLERLDSWVPWLVIGLVLGAQIGAAYSKRVKSKWIMRLLGFALFSVALRLIYKNLGF